MQSQNKITEDSNWQKVSDYLGDAPFPLQYKAALLHNQHRIILLIDMDPGGGFESGFEFTSLSAAVPVQFTSLKANVSRDIFRFALHDQGVMDRVSKFFGMEDMIVGFTEFDKQLIVKTNDVERLKECFADAETRKVFQSLSEFSLQTINDEEKDHSTTLEFMIDRAITDISELKKIYDAFVKVLDFLN